jgi:hypothetical protein
MDSWLRPEKVAHLEVIKEYEAANNWHPFASGTSKVNSFYLEIIQSEHGWVELIFKVTLKDSLFFFNRVYQGIRWQTTQGKLIFFKLKTFEIRIGLGFS